MATFYVVSENMKTGLENVISNWSGGQTLTSVQQAIARPLVKPLLLLNGIIKSVETTSETPSTPFDITDMTSINSDADWELTNPVFSDVTSSDAAAGYVPANLQIVSFDNEGNSNAGTEGGSYYGGGGGDGYSDVDEFEDAHREPQARS